MTYIGSGAICLLEPIEHSMMQFCTSSSLLYHLLGNGIMSNKTHRHSRYMCIQDERVTHVHFTHDTPANSRQNYHDLTETCRGTSHNNGCYTQVYPQESFHGLMGKHKLQLILQSAAQSHDAAKSKVLHIHAYIAYMHWHILLGFSTRVLRTGTVGKAWALDQTNASELELHSSDLCLTCNIILQSDV